MKIPKKIGEPKELVAPVFGKGMIAQSYKNPKDETVYQFRMWKGKNASIVLPITKEKEVVAIMQYRHAAEESIGQGIIWEIPGGSPSNEIEKPRELANKELRQETGFEAKKFICISEKSPLLFEPTALIANYHVYLAIDCEKVGELQLEKVEFIEIIKVPWEEWLKMTKTGVVIDSKTIVATHLAQNYLDKI